MIKQKLYIHPMVLGGYHYETEDLDSWVKYEDIEDSITTLYVGCIYVTNDMMTGGYLNPWGSLPPYIEDLFKVLSKKEYV